MRRIKYIVTSASTKGVAGVTITNATGGTEQHDVSLPWSIEFTAPSGEFVYLSAQNQTYHVSNRLIRAEIEVDGSLMKHAESTQEYGLASVSLTVP